MDEDTLMGVALDAGADDMKREGDFFVIYCDPSAYNKVLDALTKNQVPLNSSEITQLGKVPVETDAETARKVLRLHEALDDHDDVQKVYFNAHVPDEVLAEEMK